MYNDLYWEPLRNSEITFDTNKLNMAISYAKANESQWPHDMYINGKYIGCADVNDQPPYDQALGPVKSRGGHNGMIIQAGKLLAEWGDTTRADMTFSVAKSYLALLAGLAVDKGLIESLDCAVCESIYHQSFDDPHNQTITWRHLLEQTSEWKGTLFDRPDSVDAFRNSGPENIGEGNKNKGQARVLTEPGTYFEYNDVRVNLLSLFLLKVFKEPLPSVLDKHIMKPLGIDNHWKWFGYDNSWVDINGVKVQSVSGGSHWGGGLFISTRAHARIAELVCNNGRYQNHEILSPSWIKTMLTPSLMNDSYGLLWWLNKEKSLFPGAPETSIFALGGGSNMIWIDPPKKIIVVLRWVHKPELQGIVNRFSEALRLDD